MTIGIVTTYSFKRPAGLERFLLEFLKALYRVDKKNKYIIYTKKGSNLKNILQKEEIINFQVCEIGYGILWKDIGLFFAPKSNIYFFNGLRVPLFFAPKNYLTLVYDFAYKYKKIKNFKNKLKSVIFDFLSKIAFKRSKHIIAISNATKIDIKKFFNVSDNKIDVIYCGFNDFEKIKEKKLEINFNKYFLFVGTIKKRKNIHGIIKAFVKFNQKYSNDYGLVIAGKYDKNSEYVKEILKNLENNNLENKILFVNHANDEEIKYLYKNSEIFIFPSILEGFGLPILEAMSCGVPVITSNISSLKEVAGDAALLVNPYNIDKIYGAMVNMASDNNLKNNFIEKGFVRIKNFSWDKMAKEIIKLFDDFEKYFNK